MLGGDELHLHANDAALHAAHVHRPVRRLQHLQHVAADVYRRGDAAAQLRGVQQGYEQVPRGPRHLRGEHADPYHRHRGGLRGRLPPARRLRERPHRPLHARYAAYLRRDHLRLGDVVLDGPQALRVQLPHHHPGNHRHLGGKRRPRPRGGAPQRAEGHRPHRLLRLGAVHRRWHPLHREPHACEEVLLLGLREVRSSVQPAASTPLRSHVRARRL